MYVVKAILIVRHWLAVSVPIVQMDPRKPLEDTTVKATLPLLTKSTMFLFTEIQSSVGAQVRVMPPQVATKHHELKIDRGKSSPSLQNIGTYVVIQTLVVLRVRLPIHR